MEGSISSYWKNSCGDFGVSPSPSHAFVLGGTLSRRFDQNFCGQCHGLGLVAWGRDASR